MLTQCPECKTRLSNQAAYCPSCGHRVTGGPAGKSWRGMGLMAGAVLGLGVLLTLADLVVQMNGGDAVFGRVGTAVAAVGLLCCMGVGLLSWRHNA